MPIQAFSEFLLSWQVTKGLSAWAGKFILAGGRGQQAGQVTRVLRGKLAQLRGGGADTRWQHRINHKVSQLGQGYEITFPAFPRI